MNFISLNSPGRGFRFFFAQDLYVNTGTQLGKASPSGLQVRITLLWVLTFTFASNNILSFGANIINVARIESRYTS